ncbi:Photosystem I chlorophyll a apoprotein A2 [Capsicum chinense]|nr:Photosystem I chlorophyll a apoprotein A2 [Capsicum chinense]
MEAFTRGGALGPVNIAYSGVYQWWYTIGLPTNQDLYTGALFLLFLSAISLIAGLALSPLGVITSLVAQHMYSLPAYAFIAQDFTTQAASHTHHQYIVGFIKTGAFAHRAIFFIRDYNPDQNEDNVLARMLDHKEAIISHLSWASLFLGFHTLGLYVHNDVMLGFGTPVKQILIEAIFAQWIQSAHVRTSYRFDVLLLSTSGPAFNAGRSIWLPAKNGLVSRYRIYAESPFGRATRIGSRSWAGHQVHVSLPINQFLNAGVDPKEIPLPNEFILNRDLLAQVYPSFAEGATPFCTLDWSKYADFLTFYGGFDPVTGGLWPTDIAHHHLAIAILILIAGSLTIVLAHHMYSMPPYPYLATDYVTQLSLFTHHIWIDGFLIVGSAAHAAIFMVRDYDPTTRYNDLLDRVLRHRDAIISHLNWACIFLGFHSFGLYIHNDTMSALGIPEDMFSDTAIQLQPIFAQWIQNTHALAPGATAPGATASSSLSWGMVIYWQWVASSPLILDKANLGFCFPYDGLGPGDFLVHHAIALGLHTTTLILVKGALDARGSKLMPDKKDFGYSFPCDGLGQGGTCDISAWDTFYLAFFWMLNTIGLVTFYCHWKHIILWQGNVSQFNESSTYLMGWLRDYLWLDSSELINGYNPFGMNSLSVWAWMLLFGHLL